MVSLIARNAKLKKVVLVVLLVFLCLPAFAADKKISSKFDKKTLSGKDVSILGTIEKMEIEQDRLAAKEEAALKEIAAIDKELVAISKDIAKGEKSLESQQARVKRQLRLLYKKEQVSTWEYLLDTKSLQDFERRRQSLLKLGRREKAVIEDFRASLRLLESKKKELDGKRASLTKLQAELESSKKELAEKIAQKAALIKVVKKDKKLREKVRIEQENARKKSDKSIAALKNIVPLEDGAKYLQKHKGKLSCPVRGRIVQDYGEVLTKEKRKIFHSGLDIKARAGSKVKAISAGKAIYTGRLRGYGNLVVIDHGGGYVSLYGHLKKISIPESAIVKRGSVVGLIGDSGSLKGPVLFFGIRKNGKHVDPGQWARCR